MKVELIMSYEEGRMKYPTVYPFNCKEPYDMQNYLVIEWGNGEIQVESDYGEPEDNSFHRDWNWILPALERAFREGEDRSAK